MIAWPTAVKVFPNTAASAHAHKRYEAASLMTESLPVTFIFTLQQILDLCGSEEAHLCHQLTSESFKEEMTCLHFVKSSLRVSAVPVGPSSSRCDRSV